MNASRIIGCAIAVLLLVSCGRKNQTPTIERGSDGWKTYTSGEYSIQYPDTWDLDNSGNMGMTLQVLSPLASPEDNFRENMNLVVQDLSGLNVKTLEQYTRFSLSQIKSMMTNSSIVSDMRLNRDGQDYQKVVFTAVQGDLTLKFEQHYLIKGKQAFVLTLSCVADSFESYSNVGEKLLNSFRLN